MPLSSTATAGLTPLVKSDLDIVELKPSIMHSLADRDLFGEIMGLDGDVYRHHKNRRTIRAEIGGQRYFVKAHGPSGWFEVFKNLYRMRLPVLTAKPEYLAITRLHELNIPTLTCVGYGRRGYNPAKLESFIITEALESHQSLETLSKTWVTLPARQRLRLTRRAILEIGRIARTLHTNGLNHRDFYLGHFMTADRDWSTWTPDEPMTMHLIDLHRMQIRGHTPLRWLIKDLSGLLFSVFDLDLSRHDYLRFLKVYWGRDWKRRFRRTRLLRRVVIARAVTLYRRKQGRLPRIPRGFASFS